MRNTYASAVRIFVFWMLILTIGCKQSAPVKQPESEKTNHILPNPNKVYSDQCYVWLKEMPDFFRERHNLSDGLAWDRHSCQGIYVSDNPRSLFYSRHYVGETVLLFRPDEPGGGMNRANIIYQYSISQGNDGDNDQIWLMGEFKPPSDCKQWVLAATGKHRGIRAEGVWHWHWPEGRNWKQPENPPGYDYPNAEEFNYSYPGQTKGQPDMVGFDYWIETAPYGHDTQEPSLGLPATEKPDLTERITDQGYFLIKKLPDLQQRQLIPPGNKGGEPEGDQIWWWGESFPPRQAQLTLKVAKGKFEGLSGIGTWHEEWPASHKKPASLEGYDFALACEFTFDIPIQ